MARPYGCGPAGETFVRRGNPPATGNALLSSLPPGGAETTLNPAMGHQRRVIDHIFVETARFTPIRAAVIGSTPVDGEYPSDHFGVATTVALR